MQHVCGYSLCRLVSAKVLPMDDELLLILDARLATLDAHLVELEAQLGEARAKRQAVVEMLALATGEAEPKAKQQNRTHAVEELLHASPKGLHRKEIVKALREQGRTDDPDDLSASLAYLRRNGRVVNDDGAWSASKG